MNEQDDKVLHAQLLRIEEHLEEAQVHIRRAMGKTITIATMIAEILPDRPPLDPDDLL